VGKHFHFSISTSGMEFIPLYTKYGQIIANGYTRIVIGGRGNYVELSESQIINDNMHIPAGERRRLINPYSYYIEYRSNNDNTKIYLQTNTVAYADYKIGMYYIKAKEVYTINQKPVEE